jgi:hypothetical protein
MRGTKGSIAKRIARLPVAVLMGIIGYQMAKPLGPKVQEQITTNADVKGLEVLQVLRQDIINGVIIHRVSTRMTK